MKADPLPVPAVFRRVAFGAVLAAVTFVSLWPRTSLDANVPADVQRHDSLIHFACYAVLSACALWAWGRRRAPWRSRLAAWASAALYGALMEAMQALPAIGRSGSWGDARQNAVGALVGILAVPALLWPAAPAPRGPGRP